LTVLVIAGGRIVDPAMGLDVLADVRVIDGVVAEIGERLDSSDADEVLDASHAVVAPGFIDMHVHLRDPGFPDKETVATGTQAAVRGGFTAVACMPNTQPALDDPQVIASLLRDVERTARCRVYPIGAITRGRQGVVSCDYTRLVEAGAVAFSDDGDTVANARVLRHAALRALDTSAVFVSHCEDPELKRDHDPAVAEDIIVARDLLLALETGKSWHIAHLTTRGALDFVRSARARGARATCEVTPHHLVFTRSAVAELGAAAKVNPPLRTEDDLQALRDAVRDGTIDAFASDHAPHTAAEKRDFHDAAPGFTGLEIAVGAYAAALPDLPIARFVELLSTNPARILGVPGGKLSIGGPADLTIFAEREWRVDPSAFASKGKCTPFAGRVLPRKVLATVVGGSVRYRAAGE
jgi:dihydroorotase